MNGFLSTMFAGSRPATVERRSAPWYEVLVAGSSSAGVAVTPGNALTSSAVYACVRILAETVASLPLLVYRRNGRLKQRAESYPLYRLLHDAPNPLMTAFELRETLMGHLALWGNAYCETPYNAAGQVQELWPLRPDHMVQATVEDGRRLYQYQLPSGKLVWLDGARVWHLRGLSSDGLMGLSPVALMRDAIGLSLATEKYGSKFFGNGARPGGVLEHPGSLSDAAHDRLRASWAETHQGLDNAQRVAILEEGMKYTQVGIPPEDAQFLETRRFQIEEIARIFRIPPHMLADLERATFSNVEHLSIEFVTHTIRPWLVRFEQSISQALMTERDRRQYFAEFLVDGLLRGDTLSRYQAYAQARQNGWMSANDIRALENLDPVDGGDVYLVPLNMMPADQVGQGLVQEGAARDRQGRGAGDQVGHAADDSVAGAPPLRVETRAGRSARDRHRLMMAQRRVFLDVAARILRRERNDVGAAARKLLRSGEAQAVQEFERWLDGFYSEEQHGGWAAEQMLPAMLAYGQNVAAAVEDEVGGDGWDDTAERFVRRYAQAFGVRHSARSWSWLRERVEKSRPQLEEGSEEGGDQQTHEELALEEVERTLDEWVENRPERVASEEATREGNALAKHLYVMAGVIRLMSVAFGKSCPYCQALDGKIVGIQEFFLTAGQEFQPDGAERPLTASRNLGHAPYHEGCDCMVVAA